MNKQNYKKKLFILAVLSISLFWVNPTLAVVDGLEVKFQHTPLFNEANFLPGNSITRWVKVTNNTGETERIVAEAINVNDPDGFGNGLTLEIKKEGSLIYSGSLSQFFNAGEVYLSELDGNGDQAQYDFIITFYSGANNTFQGKNLGFDILVGFQGIEGGLAPGAGSGTGGFLPSGLFILEPLNSGELTSESIIINWETSYASTSQVVYAAEGEKHDFDLTEPNYGYAHAYPDPEDSTKVVSHSVTLTDLDSETTYYYRCVSHGSFALSREYSFTTLDQEEPVYYPGTLLDRVIVIAEEPNSGLRETGLNIIKGEDEEGENSDNLLSFIEQDKKTKTGLLSASASAIFTFQNLWWLLLLLAIIVSALLFVLLKKKNRIS